MSDLVSLVLALPFTSPALYTLIDTHRPFSQPSSLPHAALSKFLNRLTASLTSRDTSGQERRATCNVAAEIIREDEEGHVLATSGKAWVTSCLAQLASPAGTTTLSSLDLLVEIVERASTYPSFEREAVQPILGRLSVTLTRLLSEVEEPFLCPLLEKTQRLVLHSPAPWRPSVPSLRKLLTGHIMTSVDSEAKVAAADVLTSLVLCGGKAQVGESWKAGIRDALGGFGSALGGITQDAWVEEVVRVIPPPAPPGFEHAADPMQRLEASLARLEGWTEIVLAYLRFNAPRPVPVPIAQLVAAGLRCLNLTFDTPIVAFVSPHHRAALLAALPNIWTSGLLLLSATAIAVEDHLFPHLRQILDHSTWLAEKIPQSHMRIHAQLLRFHNLFFTLYPPALVPTEYPTRILKVCLGKMNPLLETRPRVIAENGAAGKKGKKRVRGGEDGLVGGLEGRDHQSMSEEVGELVIEALKLSKLLHLTPLLAPSLLTFSIRLHLALHLRLLSFPATAVIQSTRETLVGLLQAALLIPAPQGTEQGWKVVIIASLEAPYDTNGAADLLLHPTVPPMLCPMPPMESLHFFANEEEEEKALREELGFGVRETQGQVPEEMAVDGDDGRLELGATAAAAAAVMAIVPSRNDQTMDLHRNGTASHYAATPAAPSASTSAAITTPLGELPAPSSLNGARSTVAEDGSQEEDATTGEIEEKVEAVATTMAHDGGAGVVPTVTDSVSFMSTAHVSAKGKGRAVETTSEAVASNVVVGGDDDSEGIPELDSGSSDDEMEDDEEED